MIPELVFDDGPSEFTHALLDTLKADELDDELGRTELACQDVCGKAPHVYRSPFVRYDQKVFDRVLARGYRRVLVEPSVGDYAIETEEALVEACVGARDRGCLTIGLHEIELTARALAAIIEAIRSNERRSAA